MLKRVNKITTLLVAAASIVSMVPAMAADTQKLETKDGTIESAIAFSNGKYIYQGYKSDNDDNGIYYNAGDKDKFLQNIADADIQGTYEDKYAYLEDGDDEYLVDLTSGQVIDDATPDENLDTTVTKLKSNLKKTDRYGDITTSPSVEVIKNETNLSDEWYEYEVQPTSGADGNSSTYNNMLYGFTNRTGKYIDASNLANIYAYSSIKGKTVKIEEFSNKLGDADNETGLLATLVSKPEVLAQDKDYIYTKIKVQIYDANAADGDIKVTTSSSVVVGLESSNKIVTRTYIQKISKTQGDKKNDAYLPKSVDTYEVTSGELDSSSANDAYDALAEADNYSVVNGQLLAIKSASDNVKITSINLKKDKVKYENATKPVSFKNEKVDVYLAEKDDSDDVDVNNNDDGTAYDIDVNGNVWIVAEGKIYEFKNNQMTKVYTCDSSIDSINVYDQNNLIAWERDGDVYVTVGKAGNQTSGNTTVPPTTTPTTPVIPTIPTIPTTPAKTGWDKLADGTWNFYEANGAKATSKWINDGGVWYYLKADGAMATGWLKDNGTWYYLASSGSMKTGWLKDTNGKWYFLKSSGAMAANEVTPDGYYVDASGAWV
jgi:hypothetical protein